MNRAQLLEQAPVIDETVFATSKRILKQRFNGLMHGYLEDMTTYIAAVDQALLQKELAQIAANAHPLKSSSQSVGLLRLAAAAKFIETDARLAMDAKQLLGPLEIKTYRESVEQLKFIAQQSSQALQERL